MQMPGYFSITTRGGLVGFTGLKFLMYDDGFPPLTVLQLEKRFGNTNYPNSESELAV